MLLLKHWMVAFLCDALSLLFPPFSHALSLEMITSVSFSVVGVVINLTNIIAIIIIIIIYLLLLVV